MSLILVTGATGFVGKHLCVHFSKRGYTLRGTYRKKAWLLATANKVKARASRYGAQYRQCKDDLDAGWFRRLFI